MHYYLETNSVYKIGKIPESKIFQCYTSYLAILELISGINDETSFVKRQSTIRQIFRSNIYINWNTPHQILFQSYNITNPFNYADPLGKRLKAIAIQLTKSSDLSDFQQSREYNDPHFGFNFFKKVDETTSEKFIQATQEGHIRLQRATDAQAHVEPFSTPTGTYSINNKATLADFIHRERGLDFTINVLVNCDFVIKLLEGKIQPTEEQVLKSYNGYVDVYMQAITDYSVLRIPNAGLPAKNDCMDLLHLFYLFSGFERLIVSDDKLFDSVMRDYRIKFDNFKEL